MIAEVNGEVITRHDLDTHLRRYTNYRDLERSFQGPALERKSREIRRQVLESLIQHKLVEQEVRKKGITLDRADEAKVERLHQSSITEQFGSEETYWKVLRSRGITMEEELKKIRLQILMEKLQRQTFGGDQFVRPGEIRDYYQRMAEEIAESGTLPDELADFCLKGSLDIRQLRLPGDGEEAIRKTREQVLRGEDFAEIIRSHPLSNGPRREEGGLWSFEGTEAAFTAKRAAAIRELQLREISQVIQDRDYLYLLMVERRETARLKPFDEVQGVIHQALSRRKLDARQKEWFRGLVERAHIVHYLLEEEAP